MEPLASMQKPKRRARSLLLPAFGGVAAGFREALEYPDGTEALVGFSIAALVWTLALAVAWDFWILDGETEELSMTEVFGGVTSLAIVGRVLATGAVFGAAALAVHLVVVALSALVV